MHSQGNRLTRTVTAVLLTLATAMATGVVTASPAAADNPPSGWKSLGIPPEFGGFTRLAATSRPTGETDLFTVSGYDNRVYHRWRKTGDWTAFGSLGRPDGANGIISISAAARPSGQLYVFVSTFSGKVYQRMWASYGGWDAKWTEVKQNKQDNVRSISASVRHDGTLDLIGLGTDGNVYHRWQAYGGSFSGWGSLGKPSGGIWLDPVVASGKGVDILASSKVDNKVHRRSWTKSGGWDTWKNNGSPDTDGDTTDEVAATAARSGAGLAIFAVHGNHVYRKLRNSSGSYGGWKDFEYPGNSDHLDALTATYGYGGRLDVFVQDENTGRVYWAYWS